MNCPFCKPEISNEYIAESETCFAVFDKFPVNNGHVLIIPKRHISNYFDLSLPEQSDCWKLINEVKNIIQSKYNPDGFNIGININKSAGQTIWHVHIHLIPRYDGDVINPTGGIRNIIPGKGNYLK